ncbi:MAG: hypothetical protein RL189_2384 [Pseudomonadota bacterium]|jgi:hypothetical protein
MSSRNWSRRDLLKWGVGAGLTSVLMDSVGQMIHVPNWNRLLTGSAHPYPQWWVKDSYELTGMLGKRGSAAQLAAMLQLNEAYAQSSSDDWTLITIKIFDQVHTPLVFALGKLTEDGKNTTFAGNANHPALNKASQSKNYLMANGITDLSDDPRLASLRFNKWFGSMLLNGTFDGKDKSENSKNALGYDEYVGRFPSNVAIQTGIGLQRFNNFAVHNLTLTKIRPSLCDVNHFAGLKGLVKSPLGITAFMMGDQYDANGSVEFNVVYSGLSSTENARFEVVGRSVSRVVQNLSQSLSDDFGDYRELNSTTEKNLSLIFDKISVFDPKRREAILNSREKIKKSRDRLIKVAADESKTLVYTGVSAADIGNRQADFITAERKAKEVDSKQEFLAQCAFVANALEISGQPYKNFSLFMNVNDLDGANIDVPINGIASSYNALNYVEGMRQLAIGLNILSNAIKGKKALIMVVSDGGRTRDMGDGSGSSFAMLLGPRGEGGLDDALHAPMNVINSDAYEAASPLQTLGEQTSGLAWTTGGNDWGLRTNTGAKSNAQTMVGDWQVGVLQFFSEAQGLNIMPPELESYVRFKRFGKD